MMRLIPSSVNHISVLLKFDRDLTAQTPSLVNCVDVNSGELVYSWLLIIETVN